jgi:hypothetical protein
MRNVHHVRRSGKIPAICGGGMLALLEMIAPPREILFARACGDATRLP